MSVQIKLGQVCVGKRKIECRYIPHSVLNKRWHWAKAVQWKQAWKAETIWRIFEQMKDLRTLGKLPIVYVRMEIVLHTTYPMDRDNYHAAVKPIVDAFVEAEIIDDDREECLQLFVRQVRCKKVEQHVEINLENL